MVLELLLISENYQQRSINNRPKTISDGILEPLLITLSVVVSVIHLKHERLVHGNTELTSIISSRPSMISTKQPCVRWIWTPMILDLL
jgi:hypothetical protein